MEPLRSSLVKVVAQNSVHKIGLGKAELVGGPFDQFLVVVRNDELFVFLGECPRADVAIQRTSRQALLLMLLHCSQSGCQLPRSFEPFRMRGIL